MKNLWVMPIVLLALGCVTPYAEILHTPAQALEIGPNEWLIQSRTFTEEAAPEAAVTNATRFCYDRGGCLHVLDIRQIVSKDNYSRRQVIFSCDKCDKVPPVVPLPDERNLKPTWMP